MKKFHKSEPESSNCLRRQNRGRKLILPSISNMLRLQMSLQGFGCYPMDVWSVQTLGSNRHTYSWFGAHWSGRMEWLPSLSFSVRKLNSVHTTLCVIFMILVSPFFCFYTFENVETCVLSGCTITSKTKGQVI